LVQTGIIARQGPEFYRFISPMGEIRPHGTGFFSQVGSAVQSAADGGQAAKDEADRRAAEEAAKLAEEAARRAAAAKAEADRLAAAAAAEAARLAAEAEQLAAEAAAAVKLKIAQDPLVVLQAPQPGAGLGAPTPASAIDLAALAASEAASAAAAAAEKARAEAAAAAAEAEKLAATAAAEAERLASLIAAQARRQQEEALLEKRRVERAATAAKQRAEREAAEAKLKAEQDAAAAKVKMEQDAANAASHDFTQHAKVPAHIPTAPVTSIPLPFPVLPSGSEVEGLTADAKLRAEQEAAAAATEAERLAAAIKQAADRGVVSAASYDFTQHLWIPAPPPPAGPGKIPVPYPNLPLNPIGTWGSDAPSGVTESEPSVAVWEGEAEIVGIGKVKHGEMLVAQGLRTSIDLGVSLPDGAPRPDLVKVDPGVFGGESKAIDAGLYVWVRDGEVSLTKDDKSVDVPKGNAALATRDDVKLLDAVPNFMRFDTTPLPVLSLTAKLNAFKLPDGALQNMCVIR